MYPITTITGSLLSLLFVTISLKIIKLRRQYKVSIGAGGHGDLEKIIRAHGNFAEYVPIALLLMLCAEANHVNAIVESVLALLLIIGRLFHAYAFIFNKNHLKFRVRGMILTITVILCLSVLNCISIL